jgi:hypothetical protein
MRTKTDIVGILTNMMSHGIFDAEYIAAQLRNNGWRFVDDRQGRTPDGGVYYVQSPDGHQGYVNWYNLAYINGITAGSGFLMEGVGEGKIHPGMALRRSDRPHRFRTRIR